MSIKELERSVEFSWRSPYLGSVGEPECETPIESSIQPYLREFKTLKQGGIATPKEQVEYTRLSKLSRPPYQK